MKEDVVQWLAFYGYRVTDDDPWALDFIISSVLQYIKNYCNTDEIPQGLRHLAVHMCAGRFLQHKKSSGTLEGFRLDAAIESIKGGDTTVSFAGGALTGEQRLDGLIAQLVSPNQVELNKYRRLQW